MTDIILQTKDLRKEFGGLVAVQDVSLSVVRGHLHSVIGPNGAGKTTLLNLLSGNLRPTQGQILYNGREITHLPLHRRAHVGIGRSFQITNIFPNQTVYENVRLAAQAAHANSKTIFFTQFIHLRDYERRAYEAIDTVRLTGKERLFASMLSHGDQRRLELAMILVMNPQLMLLDEPTAGMATEQVPEVIEIIDLIRKQANRTIILVEHNMNMVMSVSDFITVMHQGAVLAEGTPQDIAANAVVQNAYLGELYGDLLKPGGN